MRTISKNATLLTRVLASAFALIFFHSAPGFAQSAMRAQQAQVKARVVPSSTTPVQGDTITAAVFIDTGDLQGVDNRLAAYQAKLEWNETILQFVGTTPGAAPWDSPNVNTAQTSNGILEWAQFLAGGAAPADFSILNVNLKVVGSFNSSSALDLSFSGMSTSFARNLLGLLEVADSSIVVGRLNTPPVLAAIPNQTLIEGTTLTVPVSASDAESVNLTLQSDQFPSFVTLQDNGNGNGVITIAPPLGFAGVYTDLQVIVFDDGSPALSDTIAFTVTVTKANTPPVLAAIPNQTLVEGTTHVVPVTASDAESVNLRLESRLLPAFVTLQDNGNGNGTITIAPPLGSAGVYSDLQVLVFDDGTPVLSDTATFALTVIRANTPPELSPIADQTIVEGQSRLITVTATDTEGDALTLRAVNFPSFASLRDNGSGNGIISLDPPLGSAGTYPDLHVIVFETANPTFADTVSFNLSVRGAEPPPVLDRIPDTTMSEGNVLELPVRATKGSGTDDIILAVNNLPAFGTFTDNHNGTGLLRFAPGFTDAGVYADIEVTAQDTSTPPLTDKFTFKLTVLNVNRPPVLEPLAFDSITIDEGAGFSLTLRASDPDNDSLSFNILNLPAFGVLTDSGNGHATLQFNPGNNDSGTYPQIIVVVTDNGTPKLSNSDEFTLIVNEVIQPLACNVEIISPAAGELICGDTVKVCVQTQASGGVGTIKSACKINGIPTVNDCAWVPLTAGLNTLVAHCTFTDALGNVCESADTIQVFARKLQATVKITSPADSTFLCGSTVNIAGSASVSGGLTPYQSVCTINGDTVSVNADSTFGGTVALALGYNTIIAACSFTDSLGCATTSRDTVVVFSDPTPPVATFNFNNLPIITGEAIDNESGIAKIEIVELNNRVVNIPVFNIGDTRVTFSSDKIDPNLRSSFTLRITNRAGCEVLADPVYVRLDPSAGQREFSFNMLHTDRFLYVNNNGLPKIHVSINNRALNLVANEEGEGRSGNTYFMLKEGQKLIDIASYLHEGENQVFVKCDATATGTADLLFADVQLGEIDDSIILPTAFALNQNYPNPFNPETRIAFDIPVNWSAPVTLRIYNMQGQLIQTLVDGVMPPGRHEVVWNGRDASGQPVATGMYFYQILSGEVKAVKKMMMTK